MFFEEIRDGGVVHNSSDSIVLCLSELHHAFQKVNFLLEDCTREGGRVWILMKAHFVATQFLALIRSIATALDVLPLSSLSASREVAELVEMVAKQARKAKIELDPDDEFAMNRIILILNQFENKFEPERSIIKPVLDHLGIRNWRDCHQEIKFLDAEISSECSENNERDVPLLSSLIGFMRYCRGVLFENSAFQATDQAEGRTNVEIMLSWLNPEDFRCPISLELMTDPVTVSTGQTYDRVSIQKWFKSGNLTCPKTGEKVTTTELVPNSNLRKLIQQYCADHGISLAKSRKMNHDISRTILPGSPAAAEAIKFLSKSLVQTLLYDGSDERKDKAAYEIRLLTKSSIFNRDCLIEAGCIPPLLILLASTDPSTQENAIAALLKLSKHSNGKKVIIHSGGLPSIVTVLWNGLKLESRQIASATLFYLSAVDKYRRLIGDTPKAIPGLVNLVKEGTACGKKNALVAIFGILLHPRNHGRVIAAGAVPLLVNLIASSDKTELISDSLAVLSTLAESFDGSDAILKASALALVIRTLNSSASRAVKDYCVSVLLSLCNNFGMEVIAVLAKDSSLMASLYSLSMYGNSQASKKARSLIKIIHKFHETSTSSLMANEIRHEHFIHVR